MTMISELELYAKDSSTTILHMKSDTLTAKLEIDAEGLEQLIKSLQKIQRTQKLINELEGVTI